MSITLKQFDGSIISPTDDAVLYAYLLGNSGVLSGCAVTSAGGAVLNIADGRGFICGRQFVIEAQAINATLPASGTANGRLLLQVDMTNTDTPATFVTQAETTLPTLQQEDINASGTIYQLPLATYTASATQVSDLKDVRTMYAAPMRSFNGRTGKVTPQSGDYKATLITMAGYTKATAKASLSTSDTVNSALGKLEYKADNPAQGTLTGYSKGTYASSIYTTDTLLAALGKLEYKADAAKYYSTTVTIYSSSWSSGTDASGTSDYYYSAAVSNVTATNNIIVRPQSTAASYAKAWSKYGVYAATQSAGYITFRASKKPSETIYANVLVLL